VVFEKKVEGSVEEGEWGGERRRKRGLTRGEWGGFFGACARFLGGLGVSSEEARHFWRRKSAPVLEGLDPTAGEWSLVVEWSSS